MEKGVAATPSAPVRLTGVWHPDEHVPELTHPILSGGRETPDGGDSLCKGTEVTVAAA